LFLPGERKSIQPLASRVAPGHDQERRFFASESPWEAGPLEQVLWQKADAMLGSTAAVLIFIDTAIPKKVGESAGVRFGTVLADAGYGACTEFRRKLTRSSLKWAVASARSRNSIQPMQALDCPARDRWPTHTNDRCPPTLGAAPREVSPVFNRKAGAASPGAKAPKGRFGQHSAPFTAGRARRLAARRCCGLLLARRCYGLLLIELVLELGIRREGNLVTPGGERLDARRSR
jgi:hypothetical protein